MGSPWIGPCQIVGKATGHTVGIQKSREVPIICVHIDDLKLYLKPETGVWSTTCTQKSALCASTVVPTSAHGSVSDNDENITIQTVRSGADKSVNELDIPLELKVHIL